MNNTINYDNVTFLSDELKEAKLIVEGENGVPYHDKTPANGERLGEYCKVGLYNVIFELAKEICHGEYKNTKPEERFEKLIDEFNNRFNDEFNNCRKKYIFEEQDVECIEYNLFDGLFLDDEEKKQGKDITREFINAYKNLRKNKENSNSFFEVDAVEKYLDAYIELCKFVFNDKCLNQEELRSLKIIENILNVEYNEKEKCFGLYSPYVLFSILRTLKYLSILPDEIDNNDLSRDCNEYLNTRRHIVSTNAIRSFSRFTIIDDKSYVVDYSRRKDRIVCKNVESVSSVDNVKPIRLLEKITSYIYNFFEDNKFLDSATFTISIYGFCAFNEGQSAEVEDLIYEIFSWFEEKKKDETEANVLRNKSIEQLNINYYLIKEEKKKEETAEEETKEYHYKYIENDQKTSYKCNLKISKKTFNEYNNVQISKCIKDSDTIFFLDCPWLAKDEYNIVNEGSLDIYARWIDHASYKNDIDESLKEQVLFNRTYLFASINDQFNRLAIDNAVKYGKVVRVIKDYLLKWLQQQIEVYKKKNIYKTVYVYNSSMRGMALSDYADYPIIREETYSNKRFSIMRFSTRDNKCISVKENQKIYISLWNLIKYVDISFAYIGIKDYFSLVLKEFKEELIKRDIISIMRNIIFVVDYCKNEKNKFKSVDVQVVFCKPVRNYFNKNNIQKKRDLFDFFGKIITEIIFKNSKGLGDDSIRDAFERSLYNQSKTVEDLFFLHLYSDLRKTGRLSNFDVTFNWEKTHVDNNEIDRLVPNFDAFGDKRAYNKLFGYLDMPKYPEYAVNSIINQTNKIFNQQDKDSHSVEIFRNIMQVCESSNYTESFLYDNLKELSDN